MPLSVVWRPATYYCRRCRAEAVIRFPEPAEPPERMDCPQCRWPAKLRTST